MRLIASFIIAAAVVTTSSSSVSLADIVHLKDGRTLEGDVKKTADGWTVNSGGAEVVVTAEEVKSIEVGSAKRDSDDSLALASLRRSVANFTDPQQAVDRYTRFIATAKGPSAAAAEADLLVWKDRANRKLVKVADRWMTADEAANVKASFDEDLVAARARILDGRTKDAKTTIDAVLAIDGQNAAALYMRGVLAFNEGDIPMARKSFDASNAATDHGPTLNNIAVAMMRQNQSAAALNMYVRAMNTAPGDPRVLDNVAEALNLLSKEEKLAAAVKKTAAVFSPLDVQLAGRMAQMGWFRWGATWVSQSELDRLMALEKQVNEQLAQFERDFRSVQDQVRAIEEEIDANNRALRRIEATSTFRDETGRIVRTAYPPSYYALQRDIDDLNVKRQRTIAQVDQLRAGAKAVRATIPSPRFSGAQRLIGAEGTPNLPPLPPPPAPVQQQQQPPANPPAGATPLPPSSQSTPPPAGTAGVVPLQSPATMPANPGPPPRSQLP